MENDELMSEIVDQKTITNLAVAIGRVEENVKYIRSNTEERLKNAESFQITAREEFSEVHGRISSVEAALRTSVKWVLGLITVLGISVTVVMKFIP